MFKRLNDKKGVFVTASMTVFLSVIGTVAVATVAGTNSFRERKAIEYCNSDGIANCEQYVANMDKSEILAFIEDTKARPRP